MSDIQIYLFLNYKILLEQIVTNNNDCKDLNIVFGAIFFCWSATKVDHDLFFDGRGLNHRPYILPIELSSQWQKSITV